MQYSHKKLQKPSKLLTNWLATPTRPDLSYDVSALDFIVKQENVECIKQANRVVKKAKIEKSLIDIPDLQNIKHLKIVAYSNASFANLTVQRKLYTLFGRK